MFNDAINDGLHPGPNPFANLRLEQSRGRKDLVALTENELHELGNTALCVLGEYGPTFRAMILFAGYVGLRPGELFALERGDLSEDEVHIRRNLDGTGQLKLPKNGKQRVVILPPPARDALLDVPPRIDTSWLFVTGRGRQFRKSSLLYYWNPVRAAFGRPGMDFYELRHFCATHLLELGVSHADVAVQLGHTDGGALGHVDLRSPIRGRRSGAVEARLRGERRGAAAPAAGDWGANGRHKVVALALLSGSSRNLNPPPPSSPQIAGFRSERFRKVMFGPRSAP
jgi:integrase